nr:hypothetical protein [Mucilaginibacter sp. SP1R1]
MVNDGPAKKVFTFRSAYWHTAKNAQKYAFSSIYNSAYCKLFISAWF